MAHSQLGGGGITESEEKESGGWKLRVLGWSPAEDGYNSLELNHQRLGKLVYSVMGTVHLYSEGIQYRL